MRSFILISILLFSTQAFAQSGFGPIRTNKASKIKLDTTMFSKGVLGASDTTVQLALQTLSASPVSIVASGSDTDSSTTESDSGLELIDSFVTLLRGCSDNEILKWDEAADDWNCEADGGGGSATAYDDITDPDSDTQIAFGTNNNAWTSTSTATFFTIDGTDGNVAVSLADGNLSVSDSIVISGDTISDFANQAGLADADSSNTDSDSGLEVVSNALTLLRGCSDDQILKWDETNDDWNCETDGGGGGSIREVVVVPFDFATETSVGDGAHYVSISPQLADTTLTAITAWVTASGLTGTLNVDLAKCALVAIGSPCSGTVTDLLSTNLTIDSGEYTSASAATAAVIDTAHQTMEHDVMIRVDVDAVHTTKAKGLIVTLGFTE